MKTSESEWAAWLQKCQQDTLLKNLADELHSQEERQFNTDLLTLILFASGHERYRFPALRILVKTFGHYGALRICLLAAKQSHERYRLIIRERGRSEIPDKGKRRKRTNFDSECWDIGISVYEKMASGKLKQNAVDETRRELKLNLSDESISRRLQRFKELARQQGFVPNSAFAQMFGTELPHSDISLKQLHRKGRPPKKGQHTKRE